jgi:hypothetical protein
MHRLGVTNLATDAETFEIGQVEIEENQVRGA